MIARRPCTVSIVSGSAVAALLLAAAMPRADADEAAAAADRMRRIDAASARGLAWLAAAQHPDGSWGSGPFRGSAAVTAQAMLAITAAGSTPASGRHAASLARGVDYLLSCAGPDGLIAGNEQAAHGPLYGHAFAMTALAEAYGETAADERVAAVLVAARAVIDRTQNDEGGWRYQPIRADADLSVTVGVLVALRALHNSRFEVDAATVARAGGFVAGLQNPDGGFRYRTAAGPSGSARTAAAALALLVADRGDEQAIAAALRWLDAHPIPLDADDGYALYGLSYEAAARWRRLGSRPDRGDQDDLQAADPAGSAGDAHDAEAARDAWHAWYGAVAERLLAVQQEDGSWRDPSCAEYGTAAALSVLCMPRGLTPLFQPWPRPPREPQP